MTDGRKRLSGGQYLKLRKEKETKAANIINEATKIDAFFKSVPKGTASEMCLQACGSSVSKEPVLVQGGIQSVAHESSVAAETEKKEEHVQGVNTDIVNLPNQVGLRIDSDPAKWQVNDSNRDSVAMFGFEQNKTADLTISRREYNDGTVRCLTINMFDRKLANGEVLSRTWLVYSQSTGCVFCGVCLLFSSESAMRRSKFSMGGFNDWKNAFPKLKEHENSIIHRNCVAALKERGRSAGRVDKKLTEQLEEETNYWRKVLHRVVVAVKALALRGLPLRGHEEKFGSSRNGNYMMLLEVIAEFDTFLAAHIAKFGHPGSGKTSYLSSSIAEEFLLILAKAVEKEVVADIKKGKYFSLIVDSTPDLSHVDQLAVIVRYVQENGTPVERFLTFLPNTGHKAEAMFDVLCNVLDCHDLEIRNCRGQSYDNAANMSGAYSGLQARFKSLNRHAEFIPCSAHSLNLVGTNAAECCSEACNFFILLQELYNFFSSSTSRWEVLQSSDSGEQGSQPNTLKNLSGTRWSARDDACRAIKNRWQSVLLAINFIEKDTTQKSLTRAEARGLGRKLNRLETAFMAECWGFLLDRLNAASKKLQRVDIDLYSVIELYDSLIQLLESIREDFDYFEEKAKTLSNVLTYECDERRKKKRKLHHDESSESEMELSGKDSFKIGTFLVIIDTLRSELQKRRQAYVQINEKFKAVTQVEKLSSVQLREAGDFLRSHFPEDLEDFFVDELMHLKSHLTISGREKAGPLELCRWIRREDLQLIYPNVDIALRMFLCTAASNCSAERAFSWLKRVKNYLRTNMTENRLNSLAIISIEGELLQKIDFSKIIDEFALQKSRRKV